MCEVVGKIKSLNLNQQISATFVKSEVVVVTGSQYPQTILIEFGGQKADLLDSYQVGETVKISLNINGRIWTNPQGEEKVFNSLQGWKIERQNTNSTPLMHYSNQPQEFKEPETEFKEEEDELPF